MVWVGQALGLPESPRGDSLLTRLERAGGSWRTQPR